MRDVSCRYIGLQGSYSHELICRMDLIAPLTVLVAGPGSYS